MRARAAALAALVLGGLLAGPARAGDSGPVTGGDPACGVFALRGAPGTDRWVVPHGFLRPGSDSLWTRRGPLVRGRDYVLDALRGEARVLVTIAPGETLWVACCWLLAPPPLDYAKQRYVPLPPVAADTAAAESAAATLPRPSTARDLVNAPGGASLAVSGNKTIAVEFGSTQDAALRQSLDLAVGGTLAPGVELTGVLSDRNTPLTATGSTQDLQSLDRVLLELRAPQAGAALGDIPLAIDRGQFARLSRQVQGVRGEWRVGGFEGMAAAASAQGVYNRIQFLGSDGLQGPYALTDRDGGSGITIVAGSEVVTLDGQRMSRGESADYSVDYDRARITFTNRRPISSASRITVEYQYAVNQYRRNIAAFSGQWRGGGARLWSAALTEGDDRGRPLVGSLSADDRTTLAAAGDSLVRAVGQGLVAGVGDYDTVRVAGRLVVAFAGPDSGSFAATFARLGEGRGDYADSAIVAGRTIYRWVGDGHGAFVLGRALPLPQSHRLVTLGGSGTLGPVVIEAEGAVSHLDANTASARDDGNDDGAAGRLTATLQGRAGPLPGRAGLALGTREVGRDFAPFSRLERPFAGEDWGLPGSADLEHQRRTDVGAFWRPREGWEARADLARLVTPDGYAGWRRSGEWTSAGAVRTHLLWLDASGSLWSARASAAGRRRTLAELSRTGRWVTPSLRFEMDDRRTPGDSVGARARVQDVGADVATGSALRWRAHMGLAGRLDRQDAGGTPGRQRITTWSGGGESPSGGPVGLAVTGQHRSARDLFSGATTRSDLAGVRARAERRPWGLSGQLAVDLTREADNARARTLTYVGGGRGAYDVYGNYVGTGDYNLVVSVSPVLERYARIATSARASWQFGSGAAWRGSRVEFTLEDEARRLGAPRAGDVFLSTGLALVDPQLARGNVLQRLEGDLAPGSRVAAVHLRAERRVQADRSFGNFAQTTDARSGALRLRGRPNADVTLETQAQVQWQSAAQVLASGPRYDRTLVGENATAQFAWQHGTGVRAAGTLELDLARPQGQRDFTRTVRVGPDVGANVGARGRAELTLRRAFVSGPAAVSLLPGADPAGFARWDGSARFDLRLHESTTAGVTATLREYPGRAAVLNGRAEVRAFF